MEVTQIMVNTERAPQLLDASLGGLPISRLRAEQHLIARELGDADANRLLAHVHQAMQDPAAYAHQPVHRAVAREAKRRARAHLEAHLEQRPRGHSVGLAIR